MPEVMVEFPKFVQEIMYDRLLGEKVTGFQDCVDHMVRGDMKELYMFDMKGIKEFNDVQSLATGDQAIATLWNNIANSSVKILIKLCVSAEAVHLLWG